MAISKNAIITGSVAAGTLGLLGLGAYALTRRKKAKKRKSSNKNSRKRNYSNHKRKKPYPYTARKRKDTSHRRIRFTSNGQPYIILRSGKARFIKKSSARRSRKLKGGRY